MGVTGGIRPTARNVAHMAEQVPDVPHQWGVIGISRAQWGLLAAALSLGGNVRVGLEDNFYLPDGDDGALERRPRRAGGADGDGRGAAARDRRRGARDAGLVSDAFFIALGDGRYQATERTSGPWDARHQHAGPPSALLLGALERTEPREEMVLARITVEILGAVPIGEMEVETAVERPGRSVELLAGEVRGGRPDGAARARVAGAARRRSAPRRPAPAPLPDADEAPRRRSARRSATRTRSSGGGRAAGGWSAARRRSGRGCGSRSSRARSLRRASA